MIDDNNIISQPFTTKTLTVSTLADSTLISNVHFEEDEALESDVLSEKEALKEPPLYAVIMYNDDYTPMDFVVFMLVSEFHHNEDEAVEIMLNIHHQGKGIAGIYARDIAETKANQVNALARQAGFPLNTQIEPSTG